MKGGWVYFMSNRRNGLATRPPGTLISIVPRTVFLLVPLGTTMSQRVTVPTRRAHMHEECLSRHRVAA